MASSIMSTCRVWILTRSKRLAKLTPVTVGFMGQPMVFNFLSCRLLRNLLAYCKPLGLTTQLHFSTMSCHQSLCIEVINHSAHAKCFATPL